MIAIKLEMHGISKSFGTPVLKDVSFLLEGGEICALLGENGAGKSTLMNILGGVIQTDSGEILLDGKPAVFSKPADSMSAGIAFIHQELNLVNDLTVYENMFIGRELKKKNGFLDSKAMLQQTQQIFDKMQFQLDPSTMVRNLDASYKQIVEIFRALMMQASIIIMDEPTTSLTDTEVERVFGMMNTLKSHGVGIVFISHRLKEVMRICDRYTVLRDGNMIQTGKVADVTTGELARAMVGHDVRTEALQRERKIGNKILNVEHYSDGNFFEDVTFQARSGEILGFTGLLGDGRSELFEALMGISSPAEGKVLFDGKPVRIRSVLQAKKLGMGFVPRNRKENGIIKDMNILENGTIVTLDDLKKGLFIDRGRQNREFDHQAELLHIKFGSKNDLITSLSGGNQQKVVLAKWLNVNLKILIFDNPTQGVDVGAKEEIYDIILRLADMGVAVVILSSEAQEVIRICDRVLVMCHGQIRGELRQQAIDEHNIMLLATGGSMEE